MIDGRTKTCFVVADPVEQLRTPQALNRIWEEQSRDIVAVPAHVAESDLADFVAGLRANKSVVGAVVTVPHKQSVVALCDELGPNASLVGAVNVIRRMPDGRLLGETFDGLGFVAGLRAEGIDPTGRRAVVLGAGGAASAVAVALLDAGVAHLDIVNRTPARGADLVARLQNAFPAIPTGVDAGRIADADLIVNATSMGMRPTDESPLARGAFPSGAIAADVVMSSAITPFLREAEARGNRVHGGIHMLAGQAALISTFIADVLDPRAGEST